MWIVGIIDIGEGFKMEKNDAIKMKFNPYYELEYQPESNDFISFPVQDRIANRYDFQYGFFFFFHSAHVLF